MINKLTLKKHPVNEVRTEIKDVGRKIFRRGSTKNRPKNSTIKPLPSGRGATEKRTKNRKKTENSTIKPLSTTSVP